MSNETLAEEQAGIHPQERGQDQAVGGVTEEPTAKPEKAVEELAEPTVTPPTGPRGGTTTITASGMVKKNFWVPEEIAERLRRAAFEERISEADIMRRGVELALEELE